MSDPALLALTALLLPALSFLLLAIVAPLRRHGHAAAYLSIALSAAALVAAVAAWRVSAAGGFSERLFSWIPAEAGPLAVVGVLADGDSTLMLILVALISFLVQVYSLGYLSDETLPSLGRYYTYQSLFAFSMMGLVLAPNFVKVFWVTKAGDTGMVVGIVLLWYQTGTFDFLQLLQLADTGLIPLEGLGVITFCIYLGAAGKSAQFQ